MKNNILLRDFVYRTLIFRILITAIIVSLLLVMVVRFIELENNNAEIQQLTSEAVEVINSSVIIYLDAPDAYGLQSTLDNIKKSNFKHPGGSFVYYEIYDQEKKLLGKSENAEYKYIDKVKSELGKVTRITNADELPVYSRKRIDDGYYVGVVLPLYNSDKRVKAFVAGVYAVSEKSVANFEKRLRRSFILVLIIVAITSVVLYPVILQLTKRLANFSTELLNANLEMLETLGGAIAKRDSDTNAHNYRVTIIAVRLAEKLSLKSSQIQGLIKGAFLHDVGKIGIRDDVLLKPGKLDENEFSIMKKHVDHGVDIVKNSDWLTDAVEVVAFHHEKYDGSGYPYGKSLSDIPVNARIFAIADVFDALTSRRPYKEPFPFDKTMEIIRDSKGTHFDTEYVEAFELIAEQLYKHLSGREDEGLRQEVLGITEKYFLSGLDTLKI